MVFGEKSLAFDKGFSSSDLLQYIELLMKEAKLQQQRSALNHYGWLKSKEINVIDLEKFKNIATKLSHESCAAVAVKLDNLMDENKMAYNDILPTFQKLLEEQQNFQLMEDNIKNVKMKRFNKVYPELGNGGRSSVSFILQ
ncbi:unnamed protein product, partial [Brenthis ino]